MRLCVLGSSSAGNSVYIASGNTGLLVDAGFSSRELVRRLAVIGVSPQDLHGVCISHEHVDHVCGLSVLHRRHAVPVYANAGTIEGLERGRAPAGVTWNVFTTGSPFSVGNLTIEPFAVPHDASEPVGFLVSDGRTTIGVATDMGMPTTLIRARLARCDAVVIESNHDVDMLYRSPRPWALKQRILGRQGHLSNERAIEMLLDIAGSRLRQVYLAHLSRECNEESAALTDARRALVEAGHGNVHVQLTFPDRVSDVWTSEAFPPVENLV